jgi:adenosylcobinamide amidohydrolase
MPITGPDATGTAAAALTQTAQTGTPNGTETARAGATQTAAAQTQTAQAGTLNATLTARAELTQKAVAALTQTAGPGVPGALSVDPVVPPDRFSLT